MTDNPPRPPFRRETILVNVDDETDVAQAEAWLRSAAGQLFYVSDQKGCGCCVLSWDVEGPTELLNTLPNAFTCESEWTSPEDDAHGAWRLMHRWQSSRIYQGHTLSKLFLFLAAFVLVVGVFRFLPW